MFIDSALQFCDKQEFGGAGNTINGQYQYATNVIDLNSLGAFDLGPGHPLYLHILTTGAATPGAADGSNPYINSILFQLMASTSSTSGSGAFATIAQHQHTSSYPSSLNEHNMIELNSVLPNAAQIQEGGKYLHLRVTVAMANSSTANASYAMSSWLSCEAPITQVAHERRI